jgi:hypothetical protein
MEDTPMTHTTLKTVALGFLLGVAVFAPLLASSAAEAGGRGREFYSETYTFDRPMNGVEGRQGDHYCSYVKTPIRQCDASGNNCKVVKWQLEQHCY